MHGRQPFTPGSATLNSWWCLLGSVMPLQHSIIYSITSIQLPLKKLYQCASGCVPGRNLNFHPYQNIFELVLKFGMKSVGHFRSIFNFQGTILKPTVKLKERIKTWNQKVRCFFFLAAQENWASLYVQKCSMLCYFFLPTTDFIWLWRKLFFGIYRSWCAWSGF